MYNVKKRNHALDQRDPPVPYMGVYIIKEIDHLLCSIESNIYHSRGLKKHLHSGRPKSSKN